MIRVHKCWVCGKTLIKDDVLPDTCNKCSQLKPEKKEDHNE